jgi:hypothetical protein
MKRIWKDCVDSLKIDWNKRHKKTMPDFFSWTSCYLVTANFLVSPTEDGQKISPCYKDDFPFTVDSIKSCDPQGADPTPPLHEGR